MINNQPPLNWEILISNEGNIHRLKVPGGWLVKVFEPVSIYFGESRGLDNGFDFRVAMTFMPDPEHTWVSAPTTTDNEPRTNNIKDTL